MFRSGTAVGLLAAALALGAPATGAAKSTSKIKLRTVSAPPATAAPGSSFTLKGQLVNTARSTQRPKLTITLRKTKTSRAIKLTAKTLARVKAGRTLRYTATVKVPASLAEGSYYVRTCVSSVCKFSAKRLTVRKPAVAPAPPAEPVAIRPAHAPGESGRDIIVAIDAGHGGVDPGASGKRGKRQHDRPADRRDEVEEVDRPELPDHRCSNASL